MEHSFLSEVMGTFISCLSVYLSVREREYAPGPRRKARFQWVSRTYRTSRTSRIQWNTRYPGGDRSTRYERFTRTTRATVIIKVIMSEPSVSNLKEEIHEYSLCNFVDNRRFMDVCQIGCLTLTQMKTWVTLFDVIRHYGIMHAHVIRTHVFKSFLSEVRSI